MTSKKKDDLTLERPVVLVQVALAKQDKPAPCFPTGFEDVDIAVLDWIVTETAAKRMLSSSRHAGNAER